MRNPLSLQGSERNLRGSSLRNFPFNLRLSRSIPYLTYSTNEIIGFRLFRTEKKS